MCGIAGKIYKEPERRVEPEALAAMSQSLIHRGPDDEGSYLRENVGLAARRLSVIDLAGGRQPLHNETRTVWMVYNGEIYNFRELRDELEDLGHQFYTRTDGEVIVHLYEEYGLAFPVHLNGMFAIALWDEAARRLILARDRMGIKPLYYAALSDRFLFASEIKAIRCDRPALALDPEAVNLYLSLLYIPAPLSIYREIRKLEAGHLLVWQDARMESAPYWSLADVRPAAGKPSAQELREELRSLLAGAVRRQLISDVPLGVFLSGGLDSSAIAALARQIHSGPLRTFSIGFDDPSHDETSYARLVARRLGTEHQDIVLRPEMPDLAQRLVEHFDEPFADSSAIPTYYVSQLARQYVTVALGGDGGDELFAGYMTYQADRLADVYHHLPGFLSQGLIPAVVRRLPVSDAKLSLDFRARRFVEHALLAPGHRHYAWKAFFSASLKQELLLPDLLASLDGGLDGYQSYERHYEGVPHRDALTRYQYADARVYLPDDNLAKVDRMSMAHSLEVRVPILDNQVVEFAFRVPGQARMPGLKLKHLFRESMRDLLPSEILRRPKQGFSVPMARWLKSDLRPLLEDTLSPETVRRQGHFSDTCVQRLVREHMSGRADYSRNLWGLLMFGLWVDHERSSAWRLAGSRVE